MSCGWVIEWIKGACGHLFSKSEFWQKRYIIVSAALFVYADALICRNVSFAHYSMNSPRAPLPYSVVSDQSTSPGRDLGAVESTFLRILACANCPFSGGFVFPQVTPPWPWKAALFRDKGGACRGNTKTKEKDSSCKPECSEKRFKSIWSCLKLVKLFEAMLKRCWSYSIIL